MATSHKQTHDDEEVTRNEEREYRSLYTNRQGTRAPLRSHDRKSRDKNSTCKQDLNILIKQHQKRIVRQEEKQQRDLLFHMALRRFLDKHGREGARQLIDFYEYGEIDDDSQISVAIRIIPDSEFLTYLLKRAKNNPDEDGEETYALMPQIIGLSDSDLGGFAKEIREMIESKPFHQRGMYDIISLSHLGMRGGDSQAIQLIKETWLSLSSSERKIAEDQWRILVDEVGHVDPKGSRDLLRWVIDNDTNTATREYARKTLQSLE